MPRLDRGPSSLTPRWREMDSNHPVDQDRAFPFKAEQDLLIRGVTAGADRSAGRCAVTGRVTISRQAALCADAAVRPIRIRNTLVAARVSYADKSLAWGHGFQAHDAPMRSHSRGWVRLASADLAEAPHIRFKDRTGPEGAPYRVRWSSGERRLGNRTPRAILTQSGRLREGAAEVIRAKTGDLGQHGEREILTEMRFDVVAHALQSFRRKAPARW